MIYIYQIINYTLSFLMWMIIGRVVFVLMLGNRDNIMMRAFVKITDPVYSITKKILPFIKDNYVAAASIALIIGLRFLLIIVFSSALQR